MTTLYSVVSDGNTEIIGSVEPLDQRNVKKGPPHKFTESADKMTSLFGQIELLEAVMKLF
jgi:hypothetical protein